MFTISQLPMFGQNFGQVFQTETGQVMKRIKGTECPEKGGFLLHVPLCGNTIETTVSVVDGQMKLNPVWVPNSVFSDAQGNYFLRTTLKKRADDALRAEEAGIGYFLNREGKGAAFSGGREVAMPQTLINEFGVPYSVIDFKLYGLMMKNLFGYVEAEKVEPIYLISDVVGTPVSSVLGGIKEHETVLEEGEVLVQNAFHGERYKQKREKLERGYEATAEWINGYQVWKPKQITQQWVVTDENVVGPLWGSFEFLAKAAINITDLDDVYGCNYDVFAGTDVAQGSHRKLRKFLPKNPLSYEDAKAMLKLGTENEVIGWQIATSAPQFVEVPVGVQALVAAV